MTNYQAVTVCFYKGDENYRAERAFNTKEDAQNDMYEQAAEYEKAGFAMNYSDGAYQYRALETNELIAEFSVSQA
jgi:hypothetical protein